MGTYVTSKCPKCNYTFERLSPSWIAFGDPRVKCPRCGITVLFKNIKEWQLRSPLERFWIILRHYTFHNLVYSLPILFVLFLLVSIIPALFGSSYNEIFTGINEVTVWTIAFSLIFAFVAIKRHISFAKEIRESKLRMQNEKYADEIKNLYKS